MTADRDALINLLTPHLSGNLRPGTIGHMAAGWEAGRLADAILAAGWRAPKPTDPQRDDGCPQCIAIRDSEWAR